MAHFLTIDPAPSGSITCIQCCHYSGPVGKRCGRADVIRATPTLKKNPGDTCEFPRISGRYAPPAVLAKGFDAISAWQDENSPAPPPPPTKPATTQPGQGNLF